MEITKDNLKEYLINHYDVTMKEILDKYKLSKENISKVKKLLKELISEKWIIESRSEDGGLEYDPGEKVDFGGLRG